MTLLYMTTEETVRLRQVLRDYLRDLHGQIGRSDSVEERSELERTEAALLGIVSELRGDAA